MQKNKVLSEMSSVSTLPPKTGKGYISHGKTTNELDFLKEVK
jgi:hypothetical protein